MEDILARLAGLLDWLAQLAPKVWAIYVRRQIVAGILDLVFSVPAWTVTLYLARSARRSLKKKDEAIEMYAVSWASIVMAAVMLLVTTLLIADGMMRLLTPEYCAIQDLLRIIQ